MAALVTLDRLKSNLRISWDDEDDDLELKLAAANAAVLRYITTPDPDWTADTAPPEVQVAVIMVASTLYASRGGAPEGGLITEPVQDVLRGYHDAVLA